jgi:hypothetical protein
MWHRMVDHFVPATRFEPDSNKQTWIGMAREFSSMIRDFDSLAILAGKETYCTNAT